MLNAINSLDAVPVLNKSSANLLYYAEKENYIILWNLEYQWEIYVCITIRLCGGFFIFNTEISIAPI